MKMRLEDKQKAIDLRRRGKTYSEIIHVIPNLPKSTLSGWVKNVKLTKEQQSKLFENIKKRTHIANVKGIWSKRLKSQRETRRLICEARREFPALSVNPLFLIGLTLYWAEGGRKTDTFQFSNSDPFIIKTMIKWLRKFCNISKKEIKPRIFIHKIYAHENCEKFWSKITSIPISQFQKTIYKPTPHTIKRNLSYKGCVQIRLSKGAQLFKKIIGWEKELIKLFKLK